MPYCLITPSDPLPSFPILLTRLLRNLIAHPHPRFTLQPLLNQPISQKLFIEALLATSDLIRVLRPEARRVWRKYLIR